MDKNALNTWKRRFERRMHLISAKSDTDTVLFPFEAYHQPSLEEARLRYNFGIRLSVVIKNLISVYREHTRNTLSDSEVACIVRGHFDDYQKLVECSGVPHNARNTKLVQSNYPSDDNDITIL